MELVLIDDHTLFIQGLKGILQEKYPSANIHIFTSFQDFKVNQPKIIDLIISDMEIPNENVLEEINTLKSTLNPKILVLSMHNKGSLINKCINLGVEGYLLKDDEKNLLKAIEVLLDGEKFFSEEIRKIQREFNDTVIELSSREEQVLLLMSKGFNNAYIAEKLFLSTETIKSHKKNIKIKFNLTSTEDLIEFSHKHFLI